MWVEQWAGSLGLGVDVGLAQRYGGQEGLGSRLFSMETSPHRNYILPTGAEPFVAQVAPGPSLSEAADCDRFFRELQIWK